MPGNVEKQIEAAKKCLSLWRDRAKGFVNNTSCPACVEAEFQSNETSRRRCAYCILNSCCEIYYQWVEDMDFDPDPDNQYTKETAQEMVDFIEQRIKEAEILIEKRSGT